MRLRRGESRKKKRRCRENNYSNAKFAIHSFHLE
jgi:hypothetical protein